MRKIIALLALSLCVFIPDSSAQADTTLSFIRNGNVRTAQAEFPLYHTSGYRKRAETLSQFLGEADALMRDSLGVGVNLNIAVLSIREWVQMGFGTYGVSFASRGAPWVVVFPAAPLRTVPMRELTESIGADAAEMMVDNFGFHEVGHAYVSEYYYAGEENRTRHMHWLDEFLAQYVTHVFLAHLASERLFVWDEYARTVVNQFGPRYHTLEEFNSHYDGYLSTADGRPNFDWFQALFASHVGELYLQHGLGFLRAVKEELPWDEYEQWTTESVLAELDLIAPGFKNWADTIWE